MDFTKLMQLLGIARPPRSWQKNFVSAARSLSDHRLPDEKTLDALASVYRMPQLQQKQLREMASQIRREPALLLFWHLWYMTLFIGTDADAETWNEWPIPPRMDPRRFGLFRALLMLAHDEPMRASIQTQKLPTRFIDDAIDSFRLVTDRFQETEEHYGISNEKMWWQRLFMQVKIFKIGRLQYEISHFDDAFRLFTRDDLELVPLCSSDQRYDEQGLASPTGIYHPTFLETPRKFVGYSYNEEGFFLPEQLTLDKKEWTEALLPQDAVLSLHIPAEGKLEKSAVLESMREAISFFDRHFPQHHFKAFTSHTWLFNTQLRYFLPEQSNILAFQELFRIVLGSVDRKCLFDFIFQQPRGPIDKLVPQNEFQRRVLLHIKTGGKLYSAAGYRLIRR